MADFSLLIKPVGSACNLGCRYCYYGGGAAAPRRNADPAGFMNEAVLERTISAYMATDQTVYSMVWHGGEPTLLPASFYEKAVELEKRHAPGGARISNSLQTNGVDITQDLARLLGRYRFLCGVSMDGPPEAHDRYRRTPSGKATHHRVRAGMRTLAEAGVPTNTVAVVSRANVHRPVATYRYLRDAGATHLHFIPCVERDGQGDISRESVTAEKWGGFLVAVFDEWRAHDIGKVSVRLFESILAKLARGVSIDCYNGDRCDRYLVIEANGDIYPCDFYVTPAHRLGNIMDTTLERVRESREYERFARRKTDWSAQCDTCDLVSICMGDCRKFRPGAAQRSLLCSGWKTFYTHALPFFSDIAARILP